MAAGAAVGSTGASHWTALWADDTAGQIVREIRLPRSLAAWLAGAPQRVKGEFVVLLHPLAATQGDGAEAERVLSLLLDELPTKTAVKLAADIAHASRNTLYGRALQITRDAEAAGEHG